MAVGASCFREENIEVDNRSMGWDGTLKGLPAPVGTYAYFVEIQCYSGETFNRKGLITLTR